MPMRVLSTEATMNMLRMAQEGVEPPPKILEHKERLEAMTQAAERRHQLYGVIDPVEMDYLLSMKLALDTLYGDWAEGTERLRWVDIPDRDGITPADIVRETCYSTEAIRGATGVEVLALYLDVSGFEGIFGKLASRYVMECRPLLGEALPLTAENLRVLEDPRAFFDTADDREASQKISEHFISFVNKDSPQHVIRAMIAHIEMGLGCSVEAINAAGFAQNEKSVENFGEKLYTPNNQEAEQAMLNTELRKAVILIELFGEYK